MIVNGINTPGVYVSKNNTAAFSGTDLNVQDFFTLMAAQLQNQSMYDTVDNTQFIAQMAQFSSLTQMTELNSAMQSNTAVSMIGKYVSISSLDEAGNQKITEGYVEQVSYKDGIPYLMVDGGFYLINDIVDITSSPVAKREEEITL